MATDRETGRSRGFGFVTLPTDAAKTAAAETDGTDYMGRCVAMGYEKTVSTRHCVRWPLLPSVLTYACLLLCVQDHSCERGLSPWRARRGR